MNFCSNCGNALTENAKFCPQCGMAQQGAPQTVVTQNQLHCPKCKNTALTPIIENAGSIGFASTWNKNSAMIGTNSQNKHYWMCNQCGHKFRNLEDLTLENNRIIRLGKLLFRGIVIFLALFSILVSLLPFADRSALFPILFILALMYVFFEWMLRRTRAKFDAEEEKLKEACFD